MERKEVEYAVCNVCILYVYGAPKFVKERSEVLLGPLWLAPRIQGYLTLQIP